MRAVSAPRPPSPTDAVRTASFPSCCVGKDVAAQAVLDIAKNHFELFGLAPSFSLDPRQLAERYRLLLSAAQQAERASEDDNADDARATSTLHCIDEAYRVLLDPLARAKYLLTLFACEPEGEQGARDNGGARLIDQMEVRASLAEASSRSDSATAVATVLTELAEQSALLGKELQVLFANPSPDNLNAARDVVSRLEFLARCRRDAEQQRAALDSRSRSGAA